jgi:hypothetical protein
MTRIRARLPAPPASRAGRGTVLGCGALAVASGAILTGFAAVAAVVAAIAAKIAILPLLVWVLLRGAE